MLDEPSSTPLGRIAARQGLLLSPRTSLGRRSSRSVRKIRGRYSDAQEDNPAAARRVPRKLHTVAAHGNKWARDHDRSDAVQAESIHDAVQPEPIA